MQKAPAIYPLIGLSSLIMMGVVLFQNCSSFLEPTNSAAQSTSSSSAAAQPTATATDSNAVADTSSNTSNFDSVLLSAFGARAKPQYLILNIANPDNLTSATSEIRTALGTGSPGRRIGFGFPVSAWTTADSVSALMDKIFAAAEANDLPVLIHFNGEREWDARPDLWNWFDASKAGYNPNNRNNVEWSNWNTPTQFSWLNWGTPLKGPPRPCFESSVVRGEVQAKAAVVAKKVLAWQARLSSLNKSYLFAGIDTGWETGIDNYTKASWVPDPASKVALGYCALANSTYKYSASNSPANLAEALQREVAGYAAFEAYSFTSVGVSKESVYTHIWGAESVVASKDEVSESAPMSASITDYSRPGLSLYPNDYSVSELRSTTNNRRWAVTESNYFELNEPWLDSSTLDLISVYNWDGSDGVKSVPAAIALIQLHASQMPVSQGFQLPQGTTLEISSNTKLVMGIDGNLVVTQNDVAVWNSGSYGQNCGSYNCYATFQGDGNFVVYNGTKPIFNSGTSGKGTSMVFSAARPFLRVLDVNQNTLWSSGN